MEHFLEGSRKCSIKSLEIEQIIKQVLAECSFAQCWIWTSTVYQGIQQCIYETCTSVVKFTYCASFPTLFTYTVWKICTVINLHSMEKLEIVCNFTNGSLVSKYKPCTVRFCTVWYIFFYFCSLCKDLLYLDILRKLEISKLRRIIFSVDLTFQKFSVN